MKFSSIIYTDHDTSLKIIKQINLIISSPDKLNFRLMRTSDYIQRFSFHICHKSDKFHTISDALFRLLSIKSQLIEQYKRKRIKRIASYSIINRNKYRI